MSKRGPIYLVINGKAAANAALREAVHTLRDEGHSIEVRVTWEAGDAKRLAAAAARQGAAVVVAAGGDGTLSEVVSGLVTVDDARPAVAVVPFGTANDFATGCGIPKDDPLAALRLAALGEALPIDVVQMNERTFINVASGGFGAQVTAETPPPLKKVLGGAAYSLMGLFNSSQLTPQRVRLFTPDGEREETILLLGVANGRLAGGGFQVAPRALLDDGLLDVVVVGDVEPREIPAVFRELVNLDIEEHEHVLYRQWPWFRVESADPLHMNLDGEPIVDTHFNFKVLPKRLPFILPPGSPLSDT